MSRQQLGFIVLFLALACPSTLFAQEREGGLKLPTTMFAAAAAADWATTYHGVKYYRSTASR